MAVGAIQLIPGLLYTIAIPKFPNGFYSTTLESIASHLVFARFLAMAMDV
jgi:hypothetical protein